jgi:TolA-binding protein
MATNWGNFNPGAKEKSAVEKGLAWAKAHQEMVAVAGIVLVLLGFGIPYFLRSQDQNERDAQDILSRGQFYLHAQVGPKNATFKTVVERNTTALQTFQRILTDYSSTKAAKIARYYEAKCQYDLGQLLQAYSSFDAASQDLRGDPLADEAYFGKVLCLQAQNQLAQAAVLSESFLKDHPDSFIASEIRLNLADIYVKNNDKAKALEQLKLVAQKDADSNWGKEADRRLKNLES